MPPRRDPSACKFCEIVAGDREAEVIHSSEQAVAFLDHRPLFPGHVLLVPREHHETLVDLPVERVGPLFELTRRLAAAVREAMGAEGTFVALNNRVSQSVPHLHVHIVPRTKGDGLRGFFWPRTKYAEGEMEAAGNAIRAALAQDGIS